MTEAQLPLSLPPSLSRLPPSLVAVENGHTSGSEQVEGGREGGDTARQLRFLGTFKEIGEWGLCDLS